MQRMSSGLRVNAASDDAAGLVMQASLQRLITAQQVNVTQEETSSTATDASRLSPASLYKAIAASTASSRNESMGVRRSSMVAGLAAETAGLSVSQVMEKITNAAVAQGNQQPQQVLGLL